MAMSLQENLVQREIHQDWANCEYIKVITSSIKKIADFLSSFGVYAPDLAPPSGSPAARLRPQASLSPALPSGLVQLQPPCQVWDGSIFSSRFDPGLAPSHPGPALC